MISGENKRILLTGASGLLGGNILYNFPKNWSGVGIVNKHSLKVVDNIKIINLDLLNEIEGFIKNENNFDVVIHTAAFTNVDKCEIERDLTHKMHVDITEKLAKWTKNINAHFVHISTDHIFDGREGNYSEKSEPTPLNYYAETKLEAENKIQAVGGKYSIIRTNFFGFNVQAKQDFAGWITESLRQNQKINLFEDVVFSPILVNRLVDLIVKVVERGSFGVINIVASDSCSKYDFGVKLASIFGLDTTLINKISIEQSNLYVKRPKNMSLSVEYAKNVLKLSLPTVNESLVAYKKLYDDGYYNTIKQINLIS